jgi:hypothetical protein
MNTTLTETQHSHKEPDHTVTDRLAARRNAADLDYNRRITIMSNIEVNANYITAGRADTTSEQLELFSHSPIDAIRLRIAENEKTPHHVLEVLAFDPCADVRIAVALNTKSQASLVARLSCDANPDVRFWMASTSYLPENILLQLAQDDNPHVAERAKKTLTARAKTLPYLSVPQ